jgi:type II secretory pathway pseudopilin PulG
MVKRTPATRAAGALRRVRGSSDTGTTLIEVVIAAVLLGILSTAVLGIILQTQAVEVGNRARVAAANLAAREIDLVREEFLRSETAPLDLEAQGTVTNPHPLAGGTAGEPLVVDGVPYTVVRSVGWITTDQYGVSACEGGNLVAYPTLGVKVTVTWPNMGSIRPVTSSTVLAPEKGTGVSTDESFVAVKVTGADAQPSVGRTVRVQSSGFTRTGTTDESGCAVVRVSPATGSGTEYTVSLGDPGYVDISGNNTPSKTTGLVARGTLNNSVRFAYDLAGTVQIVLTDPAGGSLSNADVAGSQVTLVAAQYSGASGSTVYTVSGVTTTITGLWPTQYSAYFGTTPPAEYPAAALEPGGTATLEVPFEFASTTITGLPAGTQSVIAVPSGAGTTCTSPGARTVNAADARVLPGTWDFFATGTTFACSPGPSGVVLAAGVNDPIAWEPTYLQVVDAPAGTLWALEMGKAPGALTTCPGSGGGAAVNIDAARSGFVPIPAGSWYLYVTDGPATGSCVSFPRTYNPRTFDYAAQQTFAWPPPDPATVTVTGIPTVRSRRAGLVASTAADVRCTSTNTSSCTSSGTLVILSTGSSSSATGQLAQGTWYVYGHDRGSRATWTNRVQLGGTLIIGPSTTSLTLAYNGTTPRTVGP